MVRLGSCEARLGPRPCESILTDDRETQNIDLLHAHLMPHRRANSPTGNQVRRCPASHMPSRRRRLLCGIVDFIVDMNKVMTC